MQKSKTHTIVDKARANMPSHPVVRIHSVFTGYVYYDVSTNKKHCRNPIHSGVTDYNNRYLGRYSDLTNRYLDF